MSKENWSHLSSNELKELSLAVDLLYSASKDLEAPSERINTITPLREKIKTAYTQRLEEDLDKEMQYIQGLADGLAEEK